MEVGYASLENSVFAVQNEEMCQNEADVQHEEFNKTGLIMGIMKSFLRTKYLVDKVTYLSDYCQ